MGLGSGLAGNAPRPRIGIVANTKPKASFEQPPEGVKGGRGRIVISQNDLGSSVPLLQRMSNGENHAIIERSLILSLTARPAISGDNKRRATGPQ